MLNLYALYRIYIVLICDLIIQGAPDFKFVTARDLFWVCRAGDHPLIIDPRPQGTIFQPFTTFNGLYF